VECIGLAASGEEAIGFLEHVQADVLVLDLDMPGIGGEEALRRVKARWPGTKVLILTMHDGPAMVRGLMEAGADGYLLKTSGREEMRLAVEAVAQGRRHFSLEVTEALLKRPAPSAASPKLNALSLRELEVLAALAEGLSNKEIGERYFISPRTVDTHRTNLMRKLDVHNVAGLVRLAIQAGLVK
jgi:DNA-binding NarL/FixJ family response regulator